MASAWPTPSPLVFLSPLVRKIYKDYERQRKLGLDPTFNPKALGIKGADFWEEPSEKPVPAAK